MKNLQHTLFHRTLSKQVFLFWGIFFVISCFWFFLFHNDFLYSTPILKVTSIKNVSSAYQEDQNGQKELSYKQVVSGVLLNGSKQGNCYSFPHTFSVSESTNHKYYIGEKLFVSLSSTSPAYCSVVSEKRDSYFFLLFSIFLMLFLCTAKKQGFFVILSLCLNTILFFSSVAFYRSDYLTLFRFLFCVLFFCISSLLFSSGINRKTFGAILSSLFTVFFVSLLYYFLVYKNTRLPYRYDELPGKVAYLSLDKIMFASTILGLLGAVMDVAITIHASIDSLISLKPGIAIYEVIHSTKEIGHDIMGTMVNVLFFSFLNSSLPLIVLKINKFYSISTILNVDGFFDVLRFLIGAIGIVLAIPISGLIAVFISRKEISFHHDH